MSELKVSKAYTCSEYYAMRMKEKGLMTREEAIERMKRPQECSDSEAAHKAADAILCELLWSLGYGDVVEAWGKVKKWYS